MEMKYFSQVVKYIILVLNIVIGIGALVLLVFGIIYLLSYEKHGLSELFDFFSLGTLAVGVGLLTVFASTLGCYAVFRTDACQPTIHAAVLIVLFLIQLGVGIFAVIEVSDEDNNYIEVKNLLQDLFNQTDKTSVENFYDIQAKFECCGVSGPEDYLPLRTDYPKTCCVGRTKPCLEPIQEGCAEAFTNATRRELMVIGYVTLSCAAVELFGAVLAVIARKQLFKSDSGHS